MSSDLIVHLSVIKDPRADKKKLYPLEEILLLCICAVVSGADGWSTIADFGRDKRKRLSAATSDDFRANLLF